MLPDLKRLIEQLGKDKGIEKAIIVDALETAVLTAARKKLGQNLDMEAHFNEDMGEVEVFRFMTVVENVLNPDTQISLADARATLDEEAEPGDSLGTKIEASSFGRIAVQTAKQIIIQKVRDAERDRTYEEYKDRKGELINGFVQRFEGGSIIVNLGRAEGIIPPNEQIHKETFRRGDRIRAYICDVKRISKGPQIILSRTRPQFVHALFEIEVPEISEGFIEIVSVAREPGNRSKISVRTKDKDIDPVGACVGMRGSRVQSVVQELRGEKIDIVPYTDDHVQYVCGALSPAKVGRVYMDEESRSMEVIVPDDQLSLAIGKGGQNVRLAARLTGWKIDVKSDGMMEGQEGKNYGSLLQITDMDEAIAEMLYNEGVKDIHILASADPELVALLPAVEGLSKETLSQWIDEAAKIIAREHSGNEA
jgi:N utilization substance protein A